MRQREDGDANSIQAMLARWRCMLHVGRVRSRWRTTRRARYVDIGWCIDPRLQWTIHGHGSYGGLPVYQPVYGTSVKSLSANTAVLAYERYRTDHFSTQLALHPPTHKLEELAGRLKMASACWATGSISPARSLFGEPERLRP